MRQGLRESTRWRLISSVAVQRQASASIVAVEEAAAVVVAPLKVVG